MAHQESSAVFRPPSVDKLLQTDRIEAACFCYGRSLVTDAVRDVLASLREKKNSGLAVEQDHSIELIVDSVESLLSSQAQPSLRAVFNLTGTVLHTNLGRAPMPEEAIRAVAMISRGASNPAGLATTSLLFSWPSYALLSRPCRRVLPSPYACNRRPTQGIDYAASLIREEMLRLNRT